MKRGDIILITIPFSDLTSAKVRPALVVSPEDQVENDFVVALITTNIHRPLRPSDHAIRTGDKDFGATGLRFDSVFRMAKLFNLDKALAQRKLGKVSPELMKKLEKKLKLALGIR
ncbi:MAG: type II toxin-antitoxin system PemK/MazF family toxin [candidate division KSB1 bacterium]|nr:type II toxin-antitoxin system PemK/MazF family toxin [candidate division KSB1 bacterium]MDZ7313612.1 type II toxin-antitoxin system PemK/MazF family toxin [candidate division KSB1 bacterium]